MMQQHLMAGRLSSPGKPPWPCATFCTCGLAFFHHTGRQQADALWEAHRREALGEPGWDECREHGCTQQEDLRVAGPFGYRCPDHWIEP